MDIDFWNSFEKPSNVDVVAKEGDKVEDINGVLFLLQTENEYNNVVAFRHDVSDKNIIWTLYEYCVLLRDKYGIDYIRVEGDKNKYAFLKRVFTKKEVIKDRSETERDVFYCDLKKCYKKIKLKCSEFDFYYTQNKYLESTDEKEKKKCFDKMFISVKFAVENAMKKRFGKLSKKGVVRNDFYDLVMNATLDIMGRYKKPKGYRISYLLTTADYACLGVLHNPKQVFMDSMMSYDAWESYQYNREERN